MTRVRSWAKLPLLGKDDDNSEVGHHGGDQVGAGVADAVGQLAQLGTVAHEHEHRDKNGRQNVPLGGGGAHDIWLSIGLPIGINTSLVYPPVL